VEEQKLSFKNFQKNIIKLKNSINNNLKLDRTKKIKFEDKDYFNLISIMGVFGTCANDTSNTLKIEKLTPDSDSLLKEIKKLKPEEIENQFNRISEKQFYKMFPKAKRNKRYSAVAMIDFHEQETYSKHKKTSKNIRGGKHKNGTNYFFHYGTIMIMINNKILTLGVELYKREQNITDLVIKMVKRVMQYVDIELLLLDRGFRNVEIFNELEFLQIPILMPCVKDKKAQRIFDKTLKKKKFGRVNFSITNKKKETARVTLITIKMGKHKFGFYTTIKGTWFKKSKYFIKLYMKRWNIETGYRVQNQILPKTTSINFNVRYFYFYYAIVMHNGWLILNYSKKFTQRITILMIKIILIFDWICEVFRNQNIPI